MAPNHLRNHSKNQINRIILPWKIRENLFQSLASDYGVATLSKIYTSLLQEYQCKV